jgi:hypothetical protein
MTSIQIPTKEITAWNKNNKMKTGKDLLNKPTLAITWH